MRRTPTLSRQTLYVMEQPAHRVRGAAVRCLSVLVLLTLAACSGAADVEVVAASSPPVAGSDRPSAAPSATATATEERFTAHDAKLLFRETLAEVEAVLGDLDLIVQAPALGAFADPADVELNALEVAFDALVRRQEAEQERLERRFGRINADADKADRRCGDDPDCLLANLRDYEETTDRYFARADRVTARQDEESDWLIARIEQGSGVVTAGPADAAVDGNSDGGSRAADDVSYTGDLQVGDCFDSASHAFRDVHVVPCDQPHQYEAIGVVPVPVDLDEAQRRCVREFERRLGQPVGEPDLSLLFGLVEGSETDDGRRLVVCFVGAPDDGLLQGAVVPGAS
jgi:hypothetical protein